MQKFFFPVIIIIFLLFSSLFIKNNQNSSNEISCDITIEEPILITSFGQSIDSLILKAIFDNIGVDYTYLPMDTLDNLEGYKTLFISAGSSMKSFKNSGISVDYELARCKNISDKLRYNNLNIITVHLGGKNRRDSFSDKFINLSLEISNGIIILDDADFDNLFSNYAHQENIPIYMKKKIIEVEELIQYLLTN